MDSVSESLDLESFKDAPVQRIACMQDKRARKREGDQRGAQRDDLMLVSSLTLLCSLPISTSRQPWLPLALYLATSAACVATDAGSPLARRWSPLGPTTARLFAHDYFPVPCSQPTPPSRANCPRTGLTRPADASTRPATPKTPRRSGNGTSAPSLFLNPDISCGRPSDDPCGRTLDRPRRKRQAPGDVGLLTTDGGIELLTTDVGDLSPTPNRVGSSGSAGDATFPTRSPTWTQL
ncbi:hypothetical protein BD626DRAFT_267710 [Schizophyllum amplum]|uniref:Uncharacterized protein n=1 Tax=Schizophyllum amplum TaxID=97359 RepID=A0A550BU70_9AGAR|nr:hypothetical protein BD626DRAFT_267710 [Auriculariopsis ampla]